jgi:ATP-dependent DNA helicase RecG
MWANTQPHGGVIFVGVGNDGRILGCAKSEQAHVNKIYKVGQLCPDARIEFNKIQVSNHKGEDDYVIVIRVHYRHDKLVETVEGDAYVREGDEKRRLSEAEKRELRLNRGELDCESERVNLAFPDDFDLDLLNQYRSDFLSKRQLTQK